MAGSRVRSSRPVLRWRSFDSVSRIANAPVGYMPVTSTARQSLCVSYRRLLGYRSGAGFRLGVALAWLAEGVQWPPEPASQRRSNRRGHEGPHDERIDQQ